MSKKALLPGIGYMLVAGLAMSIQGLGIRLLKGQVSIEFTIFVRFLICLAISLFVNLIVRGATHGWKFSNVGLLVFRSFVAFMALLINYIAVQYYNAGLVFIFFFSTPLFLPFITRIWLGTKILHQLWIGLIIALAGMVCVINPFAAKMQLGLLVVLIAAIFAGISFVAVRILHRTDSTKVINLAYFLVGTLGSLIFLGFSQRPYVNEFDMTVLFLLFLIGIMSYLFQLFLLQALKYAPSRVLTPFFYSSSIYSLFIDAIFFGMIPTTLAILGVFLIIIGTAINVFLFPSEHITRVGK